MDYTGQVINSIELAFQFKLSGYWKRLTEKDFFNCSSGMNLRAGWSVHLPSHVLKFPPSMELWVLIDDKFPDHQPRIFVPGLEENGSWPHVEGNGFLCLKNTKRSSPAGERIMQHLSWAIELLNYDEKTRDEEFKREFATYWERSSEIKQKKLFLSLVSELSLSRKIFYYKNKSTVIFGEDKSSLVLWLKNAGIDFHYGFIKISLIVWLDAPLVPKDFPNFNRDVLKNISENLIKEINIKSSNYLPILYGTLTDNGPVYVAVELLIYPENKLTNGYRISKLPIKRIIQSIKNNPVKRFPVQRVDASYFQMLKPINSQEIISTKKVVIVGCGAIGGYLTRLLVQAGIQHFIFIDDDYLSSRNITRHVLGARYIGKSKAESISRMICQDYPYLQTPIVYRSRIEKLSSQQLNLLKNSHIIISAGIDFIGDKILNNWRINLTNPPVHICIWAEAFALAGHSIALLGNDDLMKAFDKDGYPNLELIYWPEDYELMITEAGCSSSFQPHGAIELQRIVAMGARLVLDVLQEKIKKSCWRTWQGNYEEVLSLGGKPLKNFDVSNVERTYIWDDQINLKDDIR